MKDFDSWNVYKQSLETRTKTIVPSKRQVWWMSVGVNVGDEEDGKNQNFERPVLVVKVFNTNIFLGVPITSTNQSGKKYYCPITYNGETYYAILSQIKLFSTKRLLRKITKVSSEDFQELKLLLAKTIGL